MRFQELDHGTELIVVRSMEIAKAHAMTIASRETNLVALSGLAVTRIGVKIRKLRTLAEPWCQDLNLGQRR